jgi:hypothetical protein
VKNASRNLIGAIGVMLVVAVSAANAQSPSGGRSHQRGGNTETPRPKAEATVPRVNPTSDPIAAINSELPSLRIDLKLSAEQIPAWNAFELSVREVRNISLAGVKREMAARAQSPATRIAAINANPPSALSFFALLVDEEQQRAAAMGDMRVALKTLVEALNADQRKMFDRRIALAQQEPLGNT